MSDQEQKILRAAEDWKVPESRSKEEVWSALEKQMKSSEVSEMASSRQKWLVAASIALVASFSILYSLLFQPTVIKTAAAEQKRVELPDGSFVTLNAQSKLSYVSSSYEKNRQLKLEGEAFFEVKEGNSFTVAITDIEVKVLGTSFNVYARNEWVEVKCVTGKVEVSDDQQKVILAPGYAISSDKGTMNESPVNFEVSDAITWQQGKFLFKNEPLSKVVKELEIQYGITVRAGNLEGRQYTGYFENSNLEKAVKQVFSPMGFSYEIKDKEVIIK